ncbi:hypothetical protein BC939DRAFT_476970 [Gamsiella multidivaricata]|uniref:uncharacterized protein n=1 Tax=Gamsiella multidivaricata TaxID=101098 RepID=UPI00221FA9E7|nr:uncharacterized protein BC939DRAFT_476970 [Gamsiella multidivaricata]KAI7823792.1 hypothetical protein BC939DRAFT_476970 [Gamsiella multidivaricata]
MGMGMNGVQSTSGKRHSNRMSLVSVNWSPPQASPIQSPVLQQDPRQQQYYQHQAYAYQPMQPGPLIGQFQSQPYQQPFQQFPHPQQQQPPQQQQQPQQHGEEHVDTIPTAIVIKNIPFSVKRDSLLAILDNLDIPKPYAFNYHFDNGIFRGLAFANYRTAEEADLVYNSVNGFEVQGRKLRVEYKKVMPAAEQEKRDQEKAAAAAAAAQEALQRREMEIMENQLLEQQQERQERQRELMELQSREFDRTRNRASAALLERRDSGRSLLDRDDSSGSLNQLDLNDGETLAFYDRLLMFRGDATKDDMIFPENLSARQRRILHLIADKLSLHHYTEGEGNLRRLIIMKTPPPNSALDSSAGSAGPGTPTKYMKREQYLTGPLTQVLYLLSTSHVEQQRPMSFAGRGSLRSESPIYKSRSPLPDIPSSTTSSILSTYTFASSTTRSTGSASPTRSLYRKSMVFDAATASSTMNTNLIYPIRQPKGPEPGKVFTIREQKQLRDATMIKPAFF